MPVEEKLAEHPFVFGVHGHKAGTVNLEVGLARIIAGVTNFNLDGKGNFAGDMKLADDVVRHRKCVAPRVGDKRATQSRDIVQAKQGLPRDLGKPETKSTYTHHNMARCCAPVAPFDGQGLLEHPPTAGVDRDQSREERKRIRAGLIFGADSGPQPRKRRWHARIWREKRPFGWARMETAHRGNP